MAKIITYDLCKPGQDYSGLIARIKQYPNACKLTESCWLISSTLPCETVRDDLRRYLDDNDCIFVANLYGGAAWRNMISSHEAIKLALHS